MREPLRDLRERDLREPFREPLRDLREPFDLREPPDLRDLRDRPPDLWDLREPSPLPFAFNPAFAASSALNILYITVPHFPHLPLAMGRPFAFNSNFASLISDFALHLRQYPTTIYDVYLRSTLYINSEKKYLKVEKSQRKYSLLLLPRLIIAH